MFLKPYRIEIWVPIGITVKDVFSFSVNNFNPNGFKFIISYTQVSSFRRYLKISQSGRLRM